MKPVFKKSNEEVMNCEETNFETCKLCNAFKQCQDFKNSSLYNSDTDFHRELITEQHSCG